jgi:hypothetical protein
MRVYDNAEILFLKKSFRTDLIKNIYREFGYIKSLKLLKILYIKA